ncbi:cold-shock protein [Candidatus Liberibacter americanus]|uniref:Cold shock protein n=1 Tax=Candidatus Liberibacter americanus str. Sao Paulo TaxID=1261131 RepID=U6B4A1_9HYPH|nr:cold shock protein [Candidatus Liberibacter americanus]AHA27894.1 Cold shock protein [Candidatus Liberibacter americanus str. Sao Paulo]EMS36109.1 cold shock protein [Candidatus Liberibacter americanus PW_SP]
MATKDSVNITSELTEISGVVKWFDIIRGFGFISPSDSHKHIGDILLHVTCLRRDGYHTISAGDIITSMVQKGECGYQVFKILSMAKSVSRNVLMSPDGEISNETLHMRGILPAVVKWFDRSKKFGFLAVKGIEKDVFIHIETVRKCSLSGIYPKQAVFIRLDNGAKGPTAVEIYLNTSQSYA